MLLIARTDAESANLLSANVDIADHEFILGTTVSSVKALNQLIADAEASGATGADIDQLEKDWTASHEMCTFNKGSYPPYSALRLLKIVFQPLKKQWANRVSQIKTQHISHISHLLLGNRIMRPALLLKIFWANLSSGIVIVSLPLVSQIYDCGWRELVPRTREGYYHYKGGVEVCCFARSTRHRHPNRFSGSYQTYACFCSVRRYSVARNQETGHRASSVLRSKNQGTIPWKVCSCFHLHLFFLHAHDPTCPGGLYII